VEPDKIDVLPPTVLRDLEEVDHTLETRRSSELRSDVRETDRQDRIHLDLTLFHPVAVADLDVWTQPYPDAARDVAAANSVILSATGANTLSDSTGNGNGNGRIDPGEACDDRNQIDTDECRNDCTRPACQILCWYVRFSANLVDDVALLTPFHSRGTT